MLQKAGCWLMKEDKKLKEIITALVSNTKLPVTVKIRKGVKLKDNDAVKVAKLCEEAGASLITVHGRTQEQGYSGKSDWNTIKAVKEAISIPVIGNGDVSSPETAKEMLEYTKCDYVMVGRAARGNPFIFKQINDYLKTGKYSEISDEEKLACFFKYYKLAKKHKISFTKIKAHAMNFTKGTKQGKVLREKLIKVKNIEEIKKLFCL
jgi:nifR3 family TIM-barrel protein